MSWSYPDDYAHDLLENNSTEVLELAKLVSLSPRIEPLLLRNMRLKFLPGSDPELEYQLWFSTLITARSTQNIVLYHDAAKLLADELKTTAQFDDVWRYTLECTAHWSDLDKLEQQIRFESLLNNQAGIDQCLHQILRQLSKEQSEEERLNIARWAKKTLPLIVGPNQPSKEIAWLAQYAATALGATANWTTLSAREPMPDWLATVLPPPSEIFAPSKIGIHLRYDDGADHLVLECRPVDPSSQNLELPTPLPARLYIQSDRQTTGVWEVINTDSRIKISPAAKRIELRTIDGKRYELVADFEPTAEATNPVKSELYLTYVFGDRELAFRISQQLADKNIKVTLLQESPGNPQTFHQPGDNSKFLRLWTPAAQQQWQQVDLADTQFTRGSLLLQWRQAELPKGIMATQVINLDDMHHGVSAIHQWLNTTQSIPTESGQNDIDALLEELANPETKPRRRLEIGDKLDEIGGPRQGVGVKEYEIIEYAQEIQRLLDELNDISTEPPRRLEIGNKLAELGDPRPGVGLDDNGLPDIDWVEIAAGPFIYGEESAKQTLTLERFYISRYPVTNSQFQAFIDAGGYSDERWWQDLIKPEPQVPHWKQANRPRETVNWFEALAFTRWLSAQRGYPITLPTEQQWEKAARGTDGRVYPWGDEYRSGFANVNETFQKTGPYYLNETSAAGIYPQGKSPYHCVDMAGNVWEWCVNKQHHPDLHPGLIMPEHSNEWCALRGGSWNGRPGFACASLRNWGGPDYRGLFFGFRVVCLSPYTGL